MLGQYAFHVGEQKCRDLSINTYHRQLLNVIIGGCYHPFDHLKSTRDTPTYSPPRRQTLKKKYNQKLNMNKEIGIQIEG